MKLLRPDVAGEYHYYWQHVLPIVINGFLIDPNKIDVTEKWQVSPYFTIKTYTDIWFPYVVDPIERFHVGLFDNRTLAERHTLRLNQFLNETYQLAKKYKATVEVDNTYAHDVYKPLITETGIRLAT